MLNTKTMSNITIDITKVIYFEYKVLIKIKGGLNMKLNFNKEEFHDLKMLCYYMYKQLMENSE